MNFLTEQILEIEEADLVFNDFLEKGFDIVWRNRKNKEEIIVKTPSGENYDLSRILDRLNGKLIFGDKKQIDALRAWEFYDFCTSYGFS